MRTKCHPWPWAARLVVVAAAFAGLPAIVAACGARNQLDATTPPEAPDATADAIVPDAPAMDAPPDVMVMDVIVVDAPPDVIVMDAPPDVIVMDAPPDVIEVDAPPDVIVMDAPPDVVTVDPVGCADGTREAFADVTAYPDIAGCAGAWSHPGLAPEIPPQCGRQAGNTGAIPGGQGCNVADLCAAGWHVCRGAIEVSVSSPDGCQGSHDAPGAFFATRQSGPGCAFCATGTDLGCNNETCQAGCAQTSQITNDLFGCGTAGDVPEASSCGVLDRFSQNLCASLPPSWQCGSDGEQELLAVTKASPSGGGVVCCRD
jgi:hypothetical protein